MKLTKLPVTMETKLERISNRSRQDPRCEFSWLMQHFSVENLVTCFHDLDGKKAVGVDSLTKEEYAENLTGNLESLVEKMKTMSYHPSPSRQTFIPKADGGKRPLGIATIEDKIVQTMMAKILEAVYEPTFLDSSYGFRPARNCHQGIKATFDFLFSNWNPVILEIDFKNFFGSIDHNKLLAILRMRIKDERFIRYIARMLKSGILTREGFKKTDEGTAQGCICSPILANIFAHYGFDIWFKAVSSNNLNGKAEMVRYCDDAVFLFNNFSDAQRFYTALKGRVVRFGLELNSNKTHLIRMDKCALAKGRKQSTFDFLGFTFFLGKSKSGRVVPKLKSDAKRTRKKLKEIKAWLKLSLHQFRQLELWNRLRARVRGYIQYYGISHNITTVRKFIHQCILMFFKYINRRSHKRSFSWEKFLLFIKRYPMPQLRVRRLLF